MQRSFDEDAKQDLLQQQLELQLLASAQGVDCDDLEVDDAANNPAEERDEGRRGGGRGVE